jgi:hypothetical protein
MGSDENECMISKPRKQGGTNGRSHYRINCRRFGARDYFFMASSIKTDIRTIFHAD